MQAVKLGQAVAAIERAPRIGGGCTHWGTIPSKALRYAIYSLCDLRSNSYLREACVTVDATFAQLRNSAAAVINKQVEMRSGFYQRNGVPVIKGHARFVDVNKIEVTDSDGATETITADKFVVATGSRPYRPADVDFDSPGIFDSDTILGLDKMPRSITVIGAGVVGCEYASMFRNLGVKVNLVNAREQLLSFLDDEITDALSYHLRENGVVIRNGESYSKIESVDDGVIVHLNSGKVIKTDIVLMAIGRAGNADDLGLDKLDLVPNKRGQLEVNEDFQTTVPHIYAVGDLIGYPSLASAAYVQGRYAASHLATGKGERALVSSIPTGIYTSPEISSIGKNERELTEANVPYEVGQAKFKSLARAQIMNQTVGMLKLLFHRETLEILGVHCFGANASEIVHIGQAIMTQPGAGNSLQYFMNTTFNYPTMAEAYRVAALNGYNRLF
ncbi:UNVERIFIED_CONTAM: hypothetical protein GTU68_024396 [Idotea baltica]|nr:hypothetical protein [Idotea baltica]